MLHRIKFYGNKFSMSFSRFSIHSLAPGVLSDAGIEYNVTATHTHTQTATTQWINYRNSLGTRINPMSHTQTYTVKLMTLDVSIFFSRNIWNSKFYITIIGKIEWNTVLVRNKRIRNYGWDSAHIAENYDDGCSTEIIEFGSNLWC